MKRDPSDFIQRRAQQRWENYFAGKCPECGEAPAMETNFLSLSDQMSTTLIAAFCDRCRKELNG